MFKIVIFPLISSPRNILGWALAIFYYNAVTYLYIWTKHNQFKGTIQASLASYAQLSIERFSFLITSIPNERAFTKYDSASTYLCRLSKHFQLKISTLFRNALVLSYLVAKVTNAAPCYTVYDWLPRKDHQIWGEACSGCLRLSWPLWYVRQKPPQKREKKKTFVGADNPCTECCLWVMCFCHPVCR